MFGVSKGVTAATGRKCLNHPSPGSTNMGHEKNQAPFFCEKKMVDNTKTHI